LRRSKVSRRRRPLPIRRESRESGSLSDSALSATSRREYGQVRDDEPRERVGAAFSLQPGRVRAL
jgi:hypothetical protein